jgi:hypothetical protein
MIRVKGFELVIQVPRPADNREKPLKLVPRSTTSDKAALFDVDGGSLELINVRIVCDNKDAPMPRSMIRVKGGDLRLFGCTVQGPLDKGPDNYLRLIEFHGSGKQDPASTPAFACSQTLMISGKQVLQVVGGGARVRWQKCLALAAQDLLDFDPAELEGQCNVQVSLENNTFAVRRTAFHIGDPPAGVAPLIEPILLRADKNLFVDPFSDVPRASYLLDVTPRALGLGLVLWQGTGNAFDERWGSLLPGGGALRAWQRLWGTYGERDAVTVTWPPTTPSTFAVGAPQLERLQPPPHWAEYGADLLRLGISKKK